MPTWDLDCEWQGEMRRSWRNQFVPECEAWSRGDYCGHSDCDQCGKHVAAALRAEARLSFGGLIRLAQEVARIQEAYGVRIPDGAVTMGDVARQARMWPSSIDDVCRLNGSYAWAEGLVDAVCNAPMPRTAKEFFKTDHERWCYLLGRVAPSLAMLRRAMDQESGHDR